MNLFTPDKKGQIILAWTQIELAVTIIYMLLWSEYNYRHVWNYQKSLGD